MFARTFRPNSMRSRSVSNLRGRRSNLVRCLEARELDRAPSREPALADPLLDPEDAVLPLDVDPPPPLVPPIEGALPVDAEPVALPRAP
jgi:hypothetical protein